MKKPWNNFAIAAAPLSVAALALNSSADTEQHADTPARPPAPPPEPEPGPGPAQMPVTQRASRPYTGALLADLKQIRNRLAHPRRRAPLPPRHSLAARIHRTTTAYDQPGGRALAQLGPQTDFGSSRVLPVATRRGRWLRVIADVGGRRSAWIRWERTKVALEARRFELVADRSRRVLTLIDRGRAVKRLDVGVGRSNSPTPLGRFAVTDQLSGAPYGGAYGCCVLALSGRQTHLPPGWSGGDRLAIHATGRPDPTEGGSAGCVVASDSALRYLMRRVPVGTMVTIRR